MSMLPSWSPFFQPKVRMQGRAIQMGGKVKRVPPQDGEVLRAEVDDLSESVGKQTVTIRAEGKKAIVDCGCPLFNSGQLCQHIWAAMLDLAQADHDPALGWPLPEMLKLKPGAPKARKRDASATSAFKSTEPRWMSRLTLLKPGTTEERARNGAMNALQNAQRQVCYVVLPGASRRNRGLIVELQQRSAISTGWSKPKPLRLNADNLDTLGDPIDRELGAILIGAGRHNEENPVSTRMPRSVNSLHAAYKLTAGAQRAILRRMIATGRCFVDVGDEDRDEQKLRQLRWEDDVDKAAAAVQGQPVNTRPSAWVPWLVGRPVTGGLRLDMQLRRDGRRIAATRPLLCLGGGDGLVLFEEPLDRLRRKRTFAMAGRLDDREAFSWLAQFRDERFADDAEGYEPEPDIEEDDAEGENGESVGEGEGVGGMLVPDADVASFLERLYLLPQLPELDLPDGLGYAEQRIEPRPMLELFSPGTGQATELGATQKTQLAGRLRFDYGGSRVSPAQAGRFVPVASPEGDADHLVAATSGEAAEPKQAPTHSAAPQLDDATTAVLDRDGPAEEAIDTVLDEQPDTSSDNPADAAALSDEPEDGEDTRKLIRRNFRAEREAIEQTAGLGMRSSTAAADAVLLPSKHVPTAVSKLLALGWAVFADQKLLRTAGPPALSISSGIDWFELRGDVSFTDENGNQQTVALPAILEAARAGRQMVELGDGTQGILPEQWLNEHGLLTAMGELQGDHLRFSASQAALLDALLDDKELAEVDDTFKQAREALRGFDGIHAAQPHQDFQGTLRAYQQHGLGWFTFLRRFGMGGVLADDMGLGKTIQVLAMLQQRRKELGKDAPPSLIVAPRSVVFNWIDEAEKFTPELKLLAYTGPDRAADLKKLADYDLVVTSFGLMRRDVKKLQPIQFDYVVLDEAQAIKNPSSQSAKAARLLDAKHRLALTGTPVENHLGDLWSIFEYLNPGMLGANARFADLVRGATATIQADHLAPPSAPGKADAALTAEQAAAQDAKDAKDFDNDPDDPADDDASPTEESTKAKASPLHQLASALRPFILRRTKAQVLSDLPSKTEQTIACEMEPAQRKVYDDLKTYYRGTLINQLDADGVTANKSLGKSAFMVLEALLRLRQAACHPALIDKAGINTQGAPSAKLDALMEMLEEIVAEGQKALVFSQFTSMLGLVKDRFEQRGIRYAYLDGQTRNRRQVVEEFQTDPDLSTFLISLKAGGVGLNLTAAEYVFILDPWWNPAVEAQAIDRTHRIGQTKPVFAYRMICEDTVEQRILELQKRKRDLADAIVGGEENVLSSLTRDDLEQLLA
ncbi:MAG: DEAD/DEAH box helicase [Planctomycetota bacterium]